MNKKKRIKLIMLVLILPIFLISIISTYAVTEFLGSETSYDNSESELSSANVDAAIDELYRKITNRPEACPEGYECSDLPNVTFNANTGTFDNNQTTNTIYYDVTETSETVTKISKTSNVDDNGNKTGNMPQATSGITDTVTIEGAESLEVEITYQTRGSSYSWVTVNDGNTTPTTSNYSSSISGKLYGTTVTTKTYTVTGDTVKFFFYNGYSSSTYTNYLGYYAVVTGIVKGKEVTKNYGTYKEPSKEGYTFVGWNTESDGSGTTYKTEAEVNNYINENLTESNNLTLYAKYRSSIICKRATTLHTATCQSYSSYGCQSAGTSSGETIMYGSLGTSGTLTSGDAFDCDVNGDGTYDSATERFYYVSDYYDTTEKDFNTDVATLIYYTNVTGGTTADNTSVYAYYGTSGNYNYLGPQKDSSSHIFYHLPSTSQWSNISLYKSTRAILTQTGTAYVNAGTRTLPTAYDYEDKAARFLTTQEINSACNITVGSEATGELDTCTYLMENSAYDNSSYLQGYWLETPYSGDVKDVWFLNSEYRSVNRSSAWYSYSTSLDGKGTRPAIEILKSDISY